MNINLPFIPARSCKPRYKGVTMVMDKGYSIRQAEDLCEVSGHLVDYIKLGFGTSLFTQNLKEKVKIYHDANIRVYLGGTLLEACLLRGVLSDFFRFAEDLELDTVEVSDGSIRLDHEEKCRLIESLSEKYTVLSEVGSKQAGVVIPPDEWVSMMRDELQAGSSHVIAEARESGTVGIFDEKGRANHELINLITSHICFDKIIWEAPQKSQQAWFIKNFGAEVNLGNIPCNEIIPLETLRAGLRGDTFSQFLPDELKKRVQK